MKTEKDFWDWFVGHEAELFDLRLLSAFSFAGIAVDCISRTQAFAHS
jgi:hypothetical protein